MKSTLRWFNAFAALPGILFFTAGNVSADRRQMDDVPVGVIYGNDDRIDVYQATGSDGDKMKALADSTVALFESNDVSVDASGNARLTLESYAQSYNLCPNEPFYDQQVGAFCSGSLVGPDLVMTAGHCVDDTTCNSTKFVFGFSITQPGVNPNTIPATEVYDCSKVVARIQRNTGSDYSLVRLNRTVKNHTPLQVRRSGTIAQGASVFVIGHPAGLPTKIAGGAQVRTVTDKGFFVANLDTYGGNSGSPVFNAATGLIEGILVRGDEDFVSQGQCMVSNRCPNDGCRGEDVTKVTELSSEIAQLSAKGGTQTASGKLVSAAPVTAESLDYLKSTNLWKQ